MHDQPSEVEPQDDADATVLDLLTDDRTPWSLDELSLEVGNALDAADAVARLHAAGLVHRLEKFVFATRAAHRATQLRR